MKYLLLIAAGLAAGFLNGFIGSGGGIILIFATALIIPLPHDADITKIRFATAVASILPMSAVSVYFYMKQGAVTLDDVLPYLIPAAIGGALGAKIMDKISPLFLRFVFAVLMVWAGIRII